MLDLGLNGKVAIITGGSDGLGRAAAEKLAAEGAKVAICARRKEHLEQAADQIRKATGGQVLAHVADVSRAAAEKLAAEGAKVAICARRKEHLEQAADQIRKATGGQVLAHVADVSRAADCERLVDAVVAQWGGVDILLNNAGTSAAAAFEKVDDETWQADWDLKVMGAVRMSRLVIHHMKKRGGGGIVNLTTVGGKAPQPRALPT